MKEALAHRRDHPGFAGVIEQAAGVHHRADVAQGFERIDLGGRCDGDRALVQVHRHRVTRFQNIAQAIDAFAGIKFAGGDAVAEENAGEAFGENNPAPGRTKGDGRVFA